jgi:hypothetical protein
MTTIRTSLQSNFVQPILLLLAGALLGASITGVLNLGSAAGTTTARPSAAQRSPAFTPSAPNAVVGQVLPGSAEADESSACSGMAESDYVGELPAAKH